MNAVHVNWSKPYKCKKPNSEYYIEDFEILTTILSALEWKKHNGKIKLYTDLEGLAFYEKNELLDIWDFNINTSVLENVRDVNPNIFWAAGKFFAIANETEPFFIMDTDFIVWKKLNENWLSEPIAAAHSEELNNSVYPPINNLSLGDNHCILKDLDWTVLPSNTAFAYFNNNEFKNKYINIAMDFIKNHDQKNNDSLIYMVLVEQRLFSMVAKDLCIPISYLLNKNNDTFTHVWGYKDILRKNKILKDNFNNSCLNRINKDFPEYHSKLKKMTFLSNG